MKLHRHPPHENDEMRTNKLPQFVQDNVEHDDIYVMNEFICIQCRNSPRQKKKTKMSDQACANGLQFHDIQQDLQNIFPLERSHFSMNSIHNNTSHEMIWWPLQSKWSTCQCSSNTRSNNRYIASYA